MIALFFLAPQMRPSTPLPVGMEAPVNSYFECVHRGFRVEIERRWLTSQAMPNGQVVMGKAIAACSEARARAIAASEAALRSVRGFESPGTRRAFVRERFDSLDALARWNVSPEGDPDNGTEDAQN